MLADRIVVPMVYADEILGILEVEDLPTQEESRRQQGDTLWRLAREAALVCHAADIREHLEGAPLDVSSLLDVSD